VKILYAIQGTGNGHLARAIDVVPVLREFGQVDVLVSGTQADLSLPFEVKYKAQGLSFYFGKNGGVDLLKTFTRTQLRKVLKEISRFPVERYDVVVNDFEPISAWAARKRMVPCLALSHQAALLSDRVPRPGYFDPVGEWILHHYAPFSSAAGFHFAKFDTHIFTPVIRGAIRNATPEQRDHYTVYLPAYDDRKLVKMFMKIPEARWQVFSKHIRNPYHLGGISVYPVNNQDFVTSMLQARGVLCGAGFETPAEAMFLGKKLMVVPMKQQYEQHYNAAALRKLGVPVLKNMKTKQIPKIKAWVESAERIEMTYPDTTREAIDYLFSKAGMH
jgi:uncharacterized protein (TIGR00661 family)